MAGSLVVLGLGIRAIGHVSVEAIAQMETADTLLYLVGDATAENLVTGLHPQAFSLALYYQAGRPRADAYEAMIDHVLGSVRRGDRTVVACYGHPAICAYAPHEAIRRARAEGFVAVMLPAVSSVDCLFADLGVDPADGGCQMYEASEFFVNVCRPDPSSHLILWQVGMFGDWNHRAGTADARDLTLLVQKLCTVYPSSHLATLYEASTSVGRGPQLVRVPLGALASVPMQRGATLYLPPSCSRTADPAWLHMLEAT